VRREQKTRLEEFVLASFSFFDGHGWRDPAYLPLHGIFHHIESHIGAAIDCRGVKVGTQGIWKIYIAIYDADAPPHEEYLSEGVLQPPMRIARAEFDAAGDLVAKKRYVARAVAAFLRGLAARWSFDPVPLLELLLECEQTGEVLEFNTPVAMVRNAAGTRGARWIVRMTFHETVVGVEIDDGQAMRRLELIAWPGASFGMVCFFVSSIRWTGDGNLLLRSKPETDTLFGPTSVRVLSVDRPGVRFARVPARRGADLTDYQKSEFRFEWRIAMRELA
jgi:hypothetical protein